MTNILFLSYWGIGRGLAQVTLCYVKMLQGTEHNCFILKQGTNEISEDFKTVNAKIIEYPNYIVDKDFFKKCILDNNIKVCFFNEYKQWNTDDNELLSVCKELGVKTYGYLVMEKFTPELASEYDRLIAMSVTFERFMRSYRIRNFTYMPYSVDLKEFPDPKDNPFNLKKNDKFTFLHVGGGGGVINRKNTDLVIKSFELLNRYDAELIVTSQKPLKVNRELHPNITVIDKNLTRKELIELYYKADATVFPSKYETIGLSILDSLASGTPVITTNVPPMNEFVRNCLNGYLCEPTMTTHPGIHIQVAEIDAVELKNKMDLMMNEITYSVVKKNARYVAEELYNLEKNKKYFLDFLKKDLGEN